MSLSRKFLAGAILAVLPLTGAMACTTSAWTATVGGAVADDPDTNNATNNNPDAGVVRRYSGNCGLRPASGAASLVANDTPGTEGIYRARVYVYTGINGGAPRFFEAYSGDGGSGALFSATYDAAASEIDFTVSGTTMASVPAAQGSWFSVEFLHQSGQALQATVSGANGATTEAAPVTRTSAGNLTGNVGSARIGNINGAAITTSAAPGATNRTGFFVDEFDSTRSAATAIGRLCRGDANGNANAAVGDNDINVQDASAIVAERLGQAIAAGQPDANEDGIVNVADASLVVAMRLANVRCN